MASKPHTLQKWYLEHARSLPWRQDQLPLKRVNLYWIWLSEIMLQQTQVVTVLPYFKKFVEAFPTVQALAGASIDEVYQLWAGLGYYSRARNLHRGAQAIAARIQAGQGFPQTREQWLEVPGVGPYTAGAVCSIGLNLREPIVDGNVVRVLARVYGVEDPGSQNQVIWDLSKKWVKDASIEPRWLNQALMELGATLCTPRKPQCSECPIRRGCKGQSSPELYPQKKKRSEKVQVQETRIVLLKHSQAKWWVALQKNTGTQWREGLYDLPSQVPAGVHQVKKIDEFVSQYVVTRHQVRRHHEVWILPRSSSKTTQKMNWFALGELPAVPAPVKKALQKVEQLAISRLK